MRRSVALLIACLATAIAPVLVWAAPASAHAGLVSSDPRDGAELMAPPAGVTLTFTEDLMPDFVAFSVTDSANEPVAVSGLEILGPTVSFDWPATAPAGSYVVSFRVVSSDGHPVEGAITFSYLAPSPSPTPTPTPSPTSPSPTPDPTTASPTPSPSSTSAAPIPSPTASPSPTTTPIDPTSVTTSLGWIIAIAVIAAAGIVGIVIVVARRR